jgi:hypothetical protein
MNKRKSKSEQTYKIVKFRRISLLSSISEKNSVTSTTIADFCWVIYLSKLSFILSRDLLIIVEIWCHYYILPENAFFIGFKEFIERTQTFKLSSISIKNPKLHEVCERKELRILWQRYVSLATLKCDSVLRGLKIPTYTRRHSGMSPIFLQISLGNDGG